MRFFTSDQHLFHKNVIEFCDRPFTDLADMTVSIISNWNEALGYESDHDVFVLGDFTFGKFVDTQPILNSLLGRKHLIRGNHDKKSLKQYIEMGFDSVTDWSVINIGGKAVYLSHFPYKGFEHDDRQFEKQLNRRKEYLLHGHVHNDWSMKYKMINVGVDVRGFAPISENKIKEIIQIY